MVNTKAKQEHSDHETIQSHYDDWHPKPGEVTLLNLKKQVCIQQKVNV